MFLVADFFHFTKQFIWGGCSSLLICLVVACLFNIFVLHFTSQAVSDLERGKLETQYSRPTGSQMGLCRGILEQSWNSKLTHLQQLYCIGLESGVNKKYKLFVSPGNRIQLCVDKAQEGEHPYTCSYSIASDLLLWIRRRVVMNSSWQHQSIPLFLTEL